MRNLIGGMFGAIMGTISIVILVNPSPISYPAPYDNISFVFQGSLLLQDFSLILDSSSLPYYLLAWIIIGLVDGIVSTSKWNNIRTVVISGIVIAIIGVISIILQDTSFWTGDQVERNIIIFTMFIQSVGISFLALISSTPLVMMKKHLTKKSEKVAPLKIESTCECGASFKSNPIICSECGKVLRPDALEEITVPE